MFLLIAVVRLLEAQSYRGTQAFQRIILSSPTRRVTRSQSRYCGADDANVIYGAKPEERSSIL